jgi:RHS repeat-associated protein
MNYDSEGKLRYSQNAVQNTGGRFSYINYDARARAVESGEYTTSTTTGTANVFFQNYYLAYTAPNSGNVGTNVGIDNLDALSLVNQCTDTYSTMYEAPTGTVDIPSAFTYSAQYMGKYLNGAVCKTWNANTSTWYNYDAMGRNTAIVKQILDATYTGLKTNVNDQMKVSETVYNNFTSTVNKNIFQLNVSAEKMEVIPVYDALLRPYQTYLNSPARSGLKLSEISYDKMGRSIRNVIGNNLQGVDMVYTLGGKLKAINHPGLYNVFDRGGDNGDYTGGIPSIVNGDLFGEILEYHYNDYEAANTYSVNSISSGSSIYDGLLHSQRFKTRNSVNGTITGASDINYGGPDQLEVVSATSYQQNELMFTYSYDQYKQLGTSAFNTYNNNTNSISARTEYNETGYRGSNISYDANGNINRLIRSAYIVSGGLVNYDDLTYTISSTANNVTGILDAGTLQSATNFSTASTTVGSSLTINSIGQLTGSSPEGVSIIDYYPNGKPKKITFTNNNYTQYFYDDGGNKYKVLFRDSSSHKKKVTWYVGPGLYVLDESISTTSINLNEMNTPAGELKLNGSAYDVIYQLNDHLGNVRVTFKESGVGNGINVLSFADYYAWGGVLPGRNWSSAAYRYGYQSKEIPKDGSNWDQFELRLYNHDLGRWFAPDPYGQFHSPYVAMANNPVSAVDPNGGFTNFAPDPGHIFANKALMDLQRAYQIGNWSQKFLTKKYREAYDDIVKRYNVGTQGGSYGNVAGFLDALRITNNQFQGLGLSNSVLENGTGTLNMDAKVNYQNSIVALNSSIGTDQFQQARMGSDGGRQYSNSITGDDVIMSTCNGYDMQDQEAKAVMGSDYVQREAIQEGGLLRLQDKVGDAISGVGDGVGSNDGTPKLPGVLLDAGTTLETFVTIIANSSKQAQCPGWTEIAGFGLEDENGNTRYYLSSTEGNTEISSNNDVNEVRDAGFKILFELHSHGMGFPSQRDYNLQVGQGFSVHSVDMDGRIWSTSEYNAKYNAFGFPSGVGNADYPNSIFQQYLPLPLKR